MAGLSNVPGWFAEYNSVLKKRMKFASLAGAAANTNIAVAGAAVKDTPVLAFNVTDGVPATSLPKVTSAGQMQFTYITTGKTIIVGYYVG
jgi:hypothetical protein